MIEIAIGILGLIIAWITLRKTFYSPPKEEKENFLAYFLATQKLSRELSELMTTYATERNALDLDLYPGISYRTYISALIDSQNSNLSNSLFEELSASNLTKSNLASMLKSLEAQQEDLLKMKSVFTLAMKGA
ncbi:hypothetical protein [Pseudoflavitalea rhizosphaerae]|uniref:hypothetical protein n=1 Tax=Pseudoflavitalea rhizosphaerae TaxID=1884793 RepID=UPI000F8EE12D|nr:hypothetical protein [Pseudoflavitalea rhizosphaerae]